MCCSKSIYFLIGGRRTGIFQRYIRFCNIFVSSEQFPRPMDADIHHKSQGTSVRHLSSTERLVPFDPRPYRVPNHPMLPRCTNPGLFIPAVTVFLMFLCEQVRQNGVVLPRYINCLHSSRTSNADSEVGILLCSMTQISFPTVSPQGVCGDNGEHSSHRWLRGRRCLPTGFRNIFDNPRFEEHT